MRKPRPRRTQGIQSRIARLVHRAPVAPRDQDLHFHRQGDDSDGTCAYACARAHVRCVPVQREGFLWIYTHSVSGDYKGKTLVRWQGGSNYTRRSFIILQDSQLLPWGYPIPENITDEILNFFCQVYVVSISENYKGSCIMRVYAKMNLSVPP